MPCMALTTMAAPASRATKELAGSFNLSVQEHFGSSVKYTIMILEEGHFKTALLCVGIVAEESH